MKMSNSKGSNGLQFIITTPSKNSDKDDRKLVRSHVLRRRHQNKPPKQFPSWINRNTTDSKNPAPYINHEHELASIPLRVGSDLSFLHFPDTMQPYMFQELVKLASWARESTYPLEICVQIEPTTTTWFEHLTTDIVYFHSMLFATISHTDQLLGRESSPLALLHFAKTLKFLQERLSLPNSELATADPTITAITNLATIAVFTNDYVQAMNHMMGLAKIVELRGGLQALNKSYTRLPMKVCRTDLAISLHFGNKPILFRRQMSWNSYTSTLGVISGPQIANDTNEIYKVIKTMDERMVKVWDDLQEFCRITNLAYETSRKISTSLFNEALISTFYKLLNLSYPDEPLSEAIRIGMLAFGVSIFLSSKQVQQPYASLIESYRKAILELRGSSAETPSSITLWLLLLWNILIPLKSGLDFSGEWLAEVIVSLNIRSWTEARKILKSIMWIHFMHDKLGKQVFNNILSANHFS